MQAPPALTAPDDLPQAVARALQAFVSAAHTAFGEALRSVVVFGSAAENRMRATSDVNVIVVLSVFEAAQADQIREAVRDAHAAVRLVPMFLLESEIDAATSAFAEKFSAILRRHRVLFGQDVFAGRSIARAVQLARLRQVLLNLILRTREQYVERSLREEQLALMVADLAGPLRSCAALLLEVEGHPAASPKDALRQVATGFDAAQWEEPLRRMSEAREQRRLPAGVGAPTLLRLIELAQRMLAQAQRLD